MVIIPTATTAPRLGYNSYSCSLTQTCKTRPLVSRGRQRQKIKLQDASNHYQQIVFLRNQPPTTEWNSSFKELLLPPGFSSVGR